MESARNIDDNGFLFVKGCPISSFGIFDYGAGQLGLPGDPNRIVKVFRPESAVSDPEAINSFRDVPFIIDHEMLSGFNDDEEMAAPEEKGIDGVLTSNVYYEKPWMRGDLKIFSRKAQKALEANKKDLSLGYSCDFELTPGVFDGQPYEVVQTNLRGNHIALVEQGRVPGARVLDGLCFDHLQLDVRPSDKGQQMKKLKTRVRSTAKDNAVEQLQALIPALQQFLSEEAKEPEHQDQGMENGNEGYETDMQPLNTDTGMEPAQGGEKTAGQEPAMSQGGGESGSAQANSGVGELINQVQAILEQLRASIGGSGEGSSTDDDETEGEGMSEDDMPENENVAPVGDASEGGAEEGNGCASPGPSAGKHSMAGDSAVQRFYSDLAAKDRIYNRVSKVVGAFNHTGMDSSSLAVYSLKKLGLKAKKGQEMTALDAYLTGVEAANKKHRANVQNNARRVNAGDSAFGANSAEMDAFLSGSN